MRIAKALLLEAVVASADTGMLKQAVESQDPNTNKTQHAEPNTEHNILAINGRTRSHPNTDAEHVQV